MSSVRDFNIPTISTTTSTPTKSIISNEISPQPNLLSIEDSNGRSFTLKNTTKEDDEEETPTIPLIEHHRHYTKLMTIKQGLVLCTRTEEWYTKKKTTMREVQLRKTRLRWRQFKAVLKRDRIELYHITVSFRFMHKCSQQQQYDITLLIKKKYRTLSLQRQN